jgi:hypothetical protein
MWGKRCSFPHKHCGLLQRPPIFFFCCLNTWFFFSFSFPFRFSFCYDFFKIVFVKCYSFLFFLNMRLTWFTGLPRWPKLPLFTSLVGCLFFNWTWFFFSLFFSHIVNFFFEKNHFIKLFKVTKIKGCEKTTVHPHTLHCEWLVIHSVLLSFFFFFLNFCYDFFFKLVFVDFYLFIRFAGLPG